LEVPKTRDTEEVFELTNVDEAQDPNAKFMAPITDVQFDVRRIMQMRLIFNVAANSHFDTNELQSTKIVISFL
jgi:hypothetical protein